jgi:hypothetical protein
MEFYTKLIRFIAGLFVSMRGDRLWCGMDMSEMEYAGQCTCYWSLCFFLRNYFEFFVGFIAKWWGLLRPFKNMQEEAPAIRVGQAAINWLISLQEEAPAIRVGQAAINWLISLKKVNSLFITDSYRICQKLRDLNAFQVTFINRLRDPKSTVYVTRPFKSPKINRLCDPTV